MIIKRQKEFFDPLLPITIGSTALMMGQTAIEGKKTEEQAKAQEEQIKRQNKILNRIAKNASKNPELASQVAEVKSYSLTVKRFAVPAGAIKLLTGKNIMGFGKDLWKVVKNNKNGLIAGTLMGGAGAGAGYVANKAIEVDMRRNGMFPKKEEQKEYAIPIGSIMNTLKGAGKTVLDVAKNNKKSIGVMAGLGALPVGLGYIAERGQLKEQAKQSEKATQKEYALSLPTMKGIATGIRHAGKNIKTFFKAPGTNTLSGVSSFLGGGGKKGVNNFATKMMNSENPISQKVGNFIGNHKTAALAGSVGLGLGIMNTTWGSGDKVVRGTAKLLDKNAYAYEDSKNQMVE